MNYSLLLTATTFGVITAPGTQHIVVNVSAR
jgi:hypothetical protein